VDGFAVPVEAVETNARAGARLADVLGAVPLARPLTDLAAALPGSLTAQTAQQAAQQGGGGWVAALGALSERIAWHADQLAASARAYRDADAAAAAAMPAPPGRPR
jgi:hypothetical protein